jgi:hypothetical protein
MWQRGGWLTGYAGEVLRHLPHRLQSQALIMPPQNGMLPLVVIYGEKLCLYAALVEGVASSIGA